MTGEVGGARPVAGAVLVVHRSVQARCAWMHVCAQDAGSEADQLMRMLPPHRRPARQCACMPPLHPPLPLLHRACLAQAIEGPIIDGVGLTLIPDLTKRPPRRIGRAAGAAMETACFLSRFNLRRCPYCSGHRSSEQVQCPAPLLVPLPCSAPLGLRAQPGMKADPAMLLTCCAAQTLPA